MARTYLKLDIYTKTIHLRFISVSQYWLHEMTIVICPLCNDRDIYHIRLFPGPIIFSIETLVIQFHLSFMQARGGINSYFTSKNLNPFIEPRK